MSPKERFELRVGEELLNSVDEWAHQQSDKPVRAEAFRRLVNLGLLSNPKSTVSFSDGEKMLMLMMGDLYKHMQIKRPEVDTSFLLDTIYGGHSWAPKWELTGVFHDHEDDMSDVHYVLDILDMWSFIEEAYDKFSSKQKEVFEAKAEIYSHRIKFSGFDGNNEAVLMSIARFLVDKMNRFPRFKGRSLNAHCPTKENYNMMLKVFAPMRENIIGRSLNLDELLEIVTAH